MSLKIRVLRNHISPLKVSDPIRNPLFLSISVVFGGVRLNSAKQWKSLTAPLMQIWERERERILWGNVLDYSFPTLVFKCCFIQGKLKLVFFGSWCEVKWLTIGWFCSCPGAKPVNYQPLYIDCKVTLSKPSAGTTGHDPVCFHLAAYWSLIASSAAGRYYHTDVCVCGRLY